MSDDIAQSPEAKARFMTSADRIAKTLTLSLFYNPAVMIRQGGWLT